MPKRYSNDLRDRVLAYKDDHHTQQETCAVFGISRTTLTTWLKVRRETGSAHAQPYPKTRRRQLDEYQLKAYIEAHPDAYLREIAGEFGVSATAIMYACRRFKLTRKKRQPVMPNAMK
jgi:transposase